MPIDTADFQASLGPFGPFAPFTSFAPFAPFARGARTKRETGTWLGSFVPCWTRTAKTLSCEIPRQSRGIKSSSNEFKSTLVEQSQLTAERSSRKTKVEPRTKSREGKEIRLLTWS